jgi:hypothetical protein
VLAVVARPEEQHGESRPEHVVRVLAEVAGHCPTAFPKLSTAAP